MITTARPADDHTHTLLNSMRTPGTQTTDSRICAALTTPRFLVLLIYSKQTGYMRTRRELMQAIVPRDAGSLELFFRRPPWRARHPYKSWTHARE
jgi:hypothetical protein